MREQHPMKSDISLAKAFLPFLLTAPAWAQSVAITSPADGATIQAVNLTNGRALPILVSVTEGSGNHTYRVCATMNGRPINPQNCSVAAPWTVMAFPGLPGDGDEVYQVTSYDIFRNVLATSAAVTIHARLTGLTNSMTVSGTSGDVTITVNEWGGRNFGGACPGNLYVDGRPALNGVDFATGGICRANGATFTGFHSTALRNGLHELYVTINDDGNGTQTGGDPFLMGNTFVAGNISGSTVTLTAPQNHWLVTNRPVYFTTTGTLPAPLISGAFWGAGTSTTSPTKTVISAVSTGGSTVVTLNASPGVSVGGIVDVRNWVTAQVEHPECEGSFTVTAAAGNTFTFANAACGNLTASQNPAIMAVVTNAYYAIFASNTAAQFAASPNGSALTLGGGSTGTHTVASRISNGYWYTAVGNDAFDGYPVAFARKVVDFENGAAPMEIRPPFRELHGVTNTAGPSLCPVVVNTDLTTSTIACTAAAYTEVDDGGVSGVCSVNSSGVVSYLSNAGWCKITVAYSTFQSVTVYVQVQAGSIAFNHHTHDGHIATSYTPGQSFIPTSWWYLNCLYSTPFQPAASRQSSWDQLMFDSAINTCFTGGPGVDIVDPVHSSGCPSIPFQSDIWVRQWADAWKAKYGTPISFEYDISAFDFGPNGPYAFIHNVGYDRQTCVKNYVANVKADGRVYHFFGFDEVNAAIGGGMPILNGAVGSANFTNITVLSGVGTFHGHMAMAENRWNQATGIGAVVNFSGATVNPCLNGWRYPLTKTADVSYPSWFITAFTFDSPCADGTYSLSTDPSLFLNYLTNNGAGLAAFGSFHACTLPKYIGAQDFTYQGWNTVFDGQGNTASDTTLSSIVSNGSTYTVHIAGHQWAEGHAISISGATTAALNGMYNIHIVDANTVTTPGTAAAGTYNLGTDAGLLVGYDCAIPNNYLAQLRTILHAGGDIAITQPIIGGTYNAPPAVANWNDPAIMDAGLLYHSDPPALTYGEDGSVYNTILATQQSGLITRAYQLQPRGDLLGMGGMQYQKNHTGYLFDPALDNPNELYWRPEAKEANIMTSVTWGVSSFRGAWFQANNTGQYQSVSGSFGGGNAIGPENAKMWAGVARTFQLLQHLPQYLLQPHTNAPYFDPMFSTVQTSSSYGNLLLAVCLLDGGSTYQQTVDLSGIRLAGGSIYRISHTGYRTIYTPLAGNPTSDAYNFCAAGAGESVAYVAQPSGAVSDLTATTFTPPASLPYGASHYAIRYGYYPRDMLDDPVQPCDAGCTINLHRPGGPVWFQNLYLDANRVPMAIGDAAMLAGN